MYDDDDTLKEAASALVAKGIRVKDVFLAVSRSRD